MFLVETEFSAGLHSLSSEDETQEERHHGHQPVRRRSRFETLRFISFVQIGFLSWTSGQVDQWPYRRSSESLVDLFERETFRLCSDSYLSSTELFRFLIGRLARHNDRWSAVYQTQQLGISLQPIRLGYFRHRKWFLPFGFRLWESISVGDPHLYLGTNLEQHSWFTVSPSQSSNRRNCKCSSSMTIERNIRLFAQGLFSGSSGYQFIAETYIVCLSRELSEIDFLCVF